MGRLFVTSDLHFGHSKSFMYEPRGFTSVEEHDEIIIQNWNSVVNKDDIVYCLGDIMLNDNIGGMEKLSRLNGIIRLVRGNHDSDVRWVLYGSLSNVEPLGWAERIKVGKQLFYLSHYPALCANYDEDKPLRTKVISLCGHSHTKNPFADFDKGLIYHCELDAHNNYPVEITKVITDIKEALNIL